MASGSNHDTLRQLQITLARWKSPSAWDVVLQDDPLDKPKGEWVPSVGCNVTTANTITIPSGITLTGVSGGTYMMMQSSFDSNEVRLARDILGDVHDLFRITGTGIGQPRGSTTAYERGNEPDSGRILPGVVPYPRNRKEQRSYESMVERRQLPDLIRMAERRLGPRSEARLSSEWNAEFWKMFVRNHVADERRKTKK